MPVDSEANNYFDPVKTFKATVRTCSWRPTIIFKTHEWSVQSAKIIRCKEINQVLYDIDIVSLLMQACNNEIAKYWCLRLNLENLEPNGQIL